MAAGNELYMIDLTVEDIVEAQRETPLGEYASIVDDGTVIRLHDVVTRQPLVAGEMPPGVLGHPDLGRGIEALRRYGELGRLAVSLILADHESVADFERLHASYGPLLESAPFVGFEVASLAVANSVPVSSGIEPLFDKRDARGSFQSSVVGWAAETGKLVLPCDMIRDDQSDLNRNLRQIWDVLCPGVAADQTLRPAVKEAALTLLESAFHASRKPAIVARLGYLLLRLEEEGALPDSPLELSAIEGIGHSGSQNIFMGLGVPCESYLVENRYLHGEFGQFMQTNTELHYTGSIPLERLQRSPAFSVYW